MRCLLGWQTWRVHVKQPPLEWWMNLNRKPLIIGFVVAAVVGGLQAVNLVMDKTTRTPDLTYVMLGVVGTSLGSAFVVTKCSPPRITEMAIIMCGLLMVAALQLTTAVLSDDIHFRLRSHAVSMMAFKPFPAVFGFPILPAVVFIGATVVMDNAALLLNELHHGDTFQLRISTTSAAYALGWIGLSFMQTGRLRGVYDVQQALAAEKALMESIIAMMCDAIVWLSEDGSTVLRTDPRFAMLVGRNAVGEQMAQSLAEEEHERVQDCLRLAKAGPMLLPTTLVSDAGTRIPVEIFVVGNRNTSEANGLQEQTPAFLIGIRMASRQGTEELGDAGMRKEHADMLAQSQAEREQAAPPEDEVRTADILSSVPETSATGRIFSHVDVNRWLQGTPEDLAERLRSGLGKVDALGQTEHWLINQWDLEIKANDVLGAGAFGVVVGGWLHGSPVAVKAARSSKDANVKHLVAIANEIRVFRHIRHPNITLFHGACVEPQQGEVLLILERVKGPDLYSYVMEHSTDAEVYGRFQLLLDVAVALRYLHGQSPQIVHGDLKGSNILVEAAVPRAKLVDFGLSRLLTRGAKPLGGSLAWMAPELLLKRPTRPKPSPCADVFSFGRLAYMNLACRKPLEGIAAEVIKHKARAGIEQDLAWEEERPLQKEGKQLCKYVLSFAPEERPNMRKVHQELCTWQLPAFAPRAPAAVEPPHGAAPAANPTETRGPDALAANMHSLRQALAAGAQRQAQVASEAQDLALPARQRTQDSAEAFMLMDILRQWNYPVAPGTCCKYHAAVGQLRRIAQWMTTSNCRHDFAPYKEFQCRTCGMLDFSTPDGCYLCDKSTDRALGMVRVQEEAGTRALLSL